MRHEPLVKRRLLGPARYRPPSQGVFEGGSLAGIAAGFVMGVILIAYGAAAGAGPWYFFTMIASSVLGVAGLVGGPGTIAVGIALHLAISAFWGILFASLVNPQTRADAALWEGVLFGVAVWAIMTFVVLPVVDPTMEPRVALLPAIWVFANAAYGACLLGAPTLRRRYAVRAAVRREMRTAKQPAGV